MGNRTIVAAGPAAPPHHRQNVKLADLAASCLRETCKVVARKRGNITWFGASKANMNPNVSRLRAASLGALFIFAGSALGAASAVPTAPTVPPAPLVDKPLTPIGNDIPGEQPSPQHAWIPGHWRWLEGA